MARFETEDGCPLHYEVFGEIASGRPTIVFLNGTAQTTLKWRPNANRLKNQARVVLYDARCQGRSGGSAVPTLPRHAEDLQQLCDHLAIGRADLVGLSHGARVALATSRQFPLRIKRLMLLSLGLDPSMRTALIVSNWRFILTECGLEALMQSMLPLVFSETFLRHQARVLDKMVEALAQRNDAQKLSHLLSAVVAYPPVAAILPASAPPTRVLVGADDPLVSAEDARALAEKMAGDFMLLEDIGHSIPAEAPDRLLETMAAFFELDNPP